MEFIHIQRIINQTNTSTYTCECDKEDYFSDREIAGRAYTSVERYQEQEQMNLTHGKDLKEHFEFQSVRTTQL